MTPKLPRADPAQHDRGSKHLAYAGESSGSTIQTGALRGMQQADARVVESLCALPAP
jgi:hypothetical protein